MSVEPYEVKTVAALKVRQWLEEWNSFSFDAGERQAQPADHFYVLSMSAADLRALSGIQRRSTDEGVRRSHDLGVQRQHDQQRSEEIKRFVDGGYPWSTLPARRRGHPDTDALRKPGWLPTAIVVNILMPGEQRGDLTLDPDDAVKVIDGSGGSAQLVLPPRGDGSGLEPIEVIDGQHRLFAFDAEDDTAAAYDLPVVAFVGLDLSWQAYLFWTINIKPKRINASFAYDLYPLLREQTWLEQNDDVAVYRESRAQELTEVLWASQSSPWYRRINMLGGDRAGGPVSQSAFVRSLTLSLVKQWRARGLFGGTPDGISGLAWSRPQQAAFLIDAWACLRDAVGEVRLDWAEAVRESQVDELELAIPGESAPDPAFASKYTLLATDQGVRAFQQVINDYFFARARELKLKDWVGPESLPSDTVEATDVVLADLQRQPWRTELSKLTQELAKFDWRTASEPSLPADLRRAKEALRGSGGYKTLRIDLLNHLATADDPQVRRTAVGLRDSA